MATVSWFDSAAAGLISYEAAVRTGLTLALALLCAACGRSTTYERKAKCTRQPMTQSQLSVEGLNGLPRLWNIDACIPVTYTPSLETLKPALQSVLDAWSGESCSGLCFTAMTARADGPSSDSDLRLHIADVGSGNPGAWELVNDGNDGHTLHATIFVNTQSTVGDLLKQVGLILGFKGGFARDTVLDETKVPNPRTELGTVDAQSVCATYTLCK